MSADMHAPSRQMRSRPRGYVGSAVRDEARPATRDKVRSAVDVDTRGHEMGWSTRAAGRGVVAMVAAAPSAASMVTIGASVFVAIAVRRRDVPV
jgi:hypothetical protein